MTNLHAVVCTPRSGVWAVIISSTEESRERQDWNELSVSIPCRSYEHARAVEQAYNAKQEG